MWLKLIFSDELIFNSLWRYLSYFYKYISAEIFMISFNTKLSLNPKAVIGFPIIMSTIWADTLIFQILRSFFTNQTVASKDIKTFLKRSPFTPVHFTWADHFNPPSSFYQYFPFFLKLLTCESIFLRYWLILFSISPSLIRSHGFLGSQLSKLCQWYNPQIGKRSIHPKLSIWKRLSFRQWGWYYNLSYRCYGICRKLENTNS